MAATGKPESVTVDLDASEVALIVGEDDEGSMSVRIAAGSEVPEDAGELPAAPEIVLALATRLLKDPEFHDEVLDWYYNNLDEDEDDEEEGGEADH